MLSLSRGSLTYNTAFRAKVNRAGKNETEKRYLLVFLETGQFQWNSVLGARSHFATVSRAARSKRDLRAARKSSALSSNRFNVYNGHQKAHFRPSENHRYSVIFVQLFTSGRSNHVICGQRDVPPLRASIALIFARRGAIHHQSEKQPSPFRGFVTSGSRITERAIAPVERLFNALAATSIVRKLRLRFSGTRGFWRRLFNSWRTNAKRGNEKSDRHVPTLHSSRRMRHSYCNAILQLFTFLLYSHILFQIYLTRFLFKYAFYLNISVANAQFYNSESKSGRLSFYFLVLFSILFLQKMIKLFQGDLFAAGVF